MKPVLEQLDSLDRFGHVCTGFVQVLCKVCASSGHPKTLHLRLKMYPNSSLHITTCIFDPESPMARMAGIIIPLLYRACKKFLDDKKKIISQKYVVLMNSHKCLMHYIIIKSKLSH